MTYFDDVALIVALISLIFVLFVLVNPASRGGLTGLIGASFFLISISLILHGAIEVLGLGQRLYAVTALVASISALLAVIFIIRMIKKLTKGVDNEH